MIHYNFLFFATSGLAEGRSAALQVRQAEWVMVTGRLRGVDASIRRIVSIKEYKPVRKRGLTYLSHPYRCYRYPPLPRAYFPHK